MCGRYYYGDETEWDMRRIVSYVDDQINWNRKGDIHPSELATVVTGKKPGFAAEDMRWGFPSYQSKQLMINARSETALEKKSFSDSVMKRRCIIMAKHFYEWDRNRNKVTFTWPESPSIYMAGFYNRYEDGDRFIILTTEANESMSPVHDRMPLILAENQLEDWIYEDGMVRDFLRQGSPMLTREQEFEQLTLF
ncbi:SOS response-associated peptidase [Ruminococcus sp. 5_1_39BFAA]|uniref:SOS response-associated peptidase n=1 Tax=Ruminococcus sp. 5_1_39BFAA TaxID=457412 RepID=UPI003568F775